MDPSASAPDSMREALATLTRYSAELSQVLDDGKRKRRPGGVKRPGTPSLAGAHLPVFARNSSISSMSETMGASSSRRSSFSTKPNKSTLSASSVDTAPTTVGSTFIPYYSSPRNSADPQGAKSILPTSPASSLKHSSNVKPPKHGSSNPLPGRSSPKSIPRSCFSAYIPSLPPAASDPKVIAQAKHASRHLRPGFASVPISPTSPVDCTARRLSSSPLVNGSDRNAKNIPPAAPTKLQDVIISRPDESTVPRPEANTASKSEAQQDATIISPSDATGVPKHRVSSQTPLPSTPAFTNRPLSPASTSGADKLIAPRSSEISGNSSFRSRRSEGRIRRRDCYRRIAKQHLNDSTACYVSGSPVVSQFDVDDHVITFDDYKWAAPAWQAYCMAEKQGHTLKNPEGPSSSKAGPSSAGPSTAARPLDSGSTPPLADPFCSPEIPAFITAALADVPLGPTAPSSATHEANLVEAALAFQRSKSLSVTAQASLTEEGFAPRRASASAVASSSARLLRSARASSAAHPGPSRVGTSSERPLGSVVVSSGARPPRSPEPSSLHLSSSGYASSSARPVVSGSAASSSSRPPISRSTSSPTKPPNFGLAASIAKPPRSPEPSNLHRSISAGIPSPVISTPSGFAARSKLLVQETERIVPVPSVGSNGNAPKSYDDVVPEGFFDNSTGPRSNTKPPLPPQQRIRRQHSSRSPAKRPINKGPIDIEPEEPRAMPSTRGSARNIRMKSNRLSKLIFSSLKDKSEGSERIRSDGGAPEPNIRRRAPIRSATVGHGRKSIGARLRGGRPEKSATTPAKVNEEREGEEAGDLQDRDENAERGEGVRPIRQQSYCKTGSVPGLRRTRFMRLIGTELVCYSRDLNRELWKSQVKSAFVKLHEAQRKISVYTLLARRPIVFYLASSDMLASWSRALASASASSPPRKHTSQKTAKELKRDGVYF